MVKNFYSLRGRVLVNVEAMNMVESVGNYTKHRRVPVIIPEKGVTLLVPAVSGEMLAHCYQEHLVDIALQKSLPVCKLCKKKVFMKSTNNKVIEENLGKIPGEKELEKEIIKNCLVEDVGGFMYAEKSNVKRTSNFYVGYMIPTREVLENVVIEPQLHQRYALGTEFGTKGKGEGQMIYYVEITSSEYTFAFDLDTRYIGKTTFWEEEELEDREKRKEAALEALYNMLINFRCGAKLTRFLPIVEWESMVLAKSDSVFTAQSPFTANYIERTIKKAEKFNDVELFIYINPIIFESSEEYIKKRTEEIIDEAKKVLEEFRKKLPNLDYDKIEKTFFENLLVERLNELVNSESMKYYSKIVKKYEEAKRLAKEKGIEVLDSLEDLLSELKE